MNTTDNQNRKASDEGIAVEHVNKMNDISQGSAENTISDLTESIEARPGLARSMIPIHQCEEDLRSQWQLVDVVLKEKQSTCSSQDLENFDLQAVATIRANRESNEHCLLRVAIDNNVPSDVIDLLLSADDSGRIILEKDVLQDLLCNYPIRQEWMDNYLAKPLMDYIMASSIHKNKSIRLRLPDNAYSALAKSIVSSEDLKENITNHTIARSVLAILFLDFYMHIVLIISFTIATNIFLKGMSRNLNPSSVVIPSLICQKNQRYRRRSCRNERNKREKLVDSFSVGRYAV